MKRITIYSPNYYTYGSMLIGGILREKFKGKYDVKLINNLDKKLLLNSDVVVLSLYSTMHLIDDDIKDIVDFIKKTNGAKNTKLYVAGPVSAYPEIVLGELKVDGVIVGEGELITPNIVEGEKEGLAYVENGEVIINIPKSKPELDFSKLLIPRDIGAQTIRGANVYLETHRGCFGNCTFCQVPKFFGKEIRSKPLDLILEEVKEFKKRGVKRIAISGGTGSLYNFKKSSNKNMFIELLEKISEIIGKEHLSVPDMRVDYIDEEILDAVKNYTIGWVFYGIESGSDKILREMKKGTTVEKNLNAIKLAKDCGVKVAGSFIVGYPTETEMDYLLTKDFIVDAELDDIFISIAEPIPTTELCELVLKTPKEKNPNFKTHLGPYRSLGMTESEAKCFDLMLHSESWKSNPRVMTKQLYATYLNEAKMQGRDIRKITDLIFKYENVLK